MKYTDKLGLSYIFIVIFYIIVGIIGLIAELGIIFLSIVFLTSVILIPIATIIVNKIDIRETKLSRKCENCFYYQIDWCNLFELITMKQHWCSKHKLKR